MSAVLERVLAGLHGVVPSGDGFVALCPLHNDHRASLSVKDGEKGVVLNCHAGCSPEAVVAALGLTMRDLFFDSVVNGNGSSNQQRPPRVVATYPYVDENGTPLFEVLRYEPKGFRQRKPDGNGEWIYKLGDVHRVLYRLPEVLAAQEVYVVEGEKDCETARAHGLVATCNPGGAGKWLPAFSESLRGKNVAIIPDADAPGRKHAQQVAESLWLVAASVKILELPGAKDLSEWFERGGTRDSLLELIRNTPEWKPPSHAVGGFPLTPLAELLARPDIPTEFIVDNFLVAGTVSCIVAKPKVGKSTLARNLCLSVSRGEDFLGLATKQGECVYLALEERATDIKRDFRSMGADGTEPINVYVAAAPPDGIAALCDLVRKRRPRLVIGDPLFRLVKIREENSYAEIYATLGPLIDVTRETGTHVALTHHSGKNVRSDAIDSPLGSTALGGIVNTLIVLKRTESVRTIQTVQRVCRDLDETLLEFDPESRTLSLGTEKSDVDAQKVATNIGAYLQSIEGARTEPDIMKAVEGKTGLKRKALRLLVEAGHVNRIGAGAKGNPFTYTFSFPRSDPYTGTRERESQNSGETLINQRDILVPGHKSLTNREERVSRPEEQAFSAQEQGAEVGSAEAERFWGEHARLFPLIGKKVHTPKGMGRLETAYATGCEVVLDSTGRIAIFQPGEIRGERLKENL